MFLRASYTCATIIIPYNFISFEKFAAFWIYSIPTSPKRCTPNDKLLLCAGASLTFDCSEFWQLSVKDDLLPCHKFPQHSCLCSQLRLLGSTRHCFRFGTASVQRTISLLTFAWVESSHNDDKIRTGAPRVGCLPNCPALLCHAWPNFCVPSNRINMLCPSRSQLTHNSIHTIASFEFIRFSVTKLFALPRSIPVPVSHFPFHENAARTFRWPRERSLSSYTYRRCYGRLSCRGSREDERIQFATQFVGAANPVHFHLVCVRVSSWHAHSPSFNSHHRQPLRLTCPGPHPSKKIRASRLVRSTHWLPCRRRHNRHFTLPRAQQSYSKIKRHVFRRHLWISMQNVKSRNFTL